MALLVATVVPCSFFWPDEGRRKKSHGTLVQLHVRPKDKLNTNYQKDKHNYHCAVHGYGYIPSCMFLDEKVNLEQTNSYSGPELSPCDIV